MRPPGRVFHFGLVCLLLGWLSAGWLESARATPITGAAVFLILVLVVAASADRL